MEWHTTCIKGFQGENFMNNKAGFSLMELMVVIMLIAIMAAIAVPNMGAWLANHRLSSSARDIYSMMQLARMRAVRDNADVCFFFDS
jgi:type IV fimbrial biogenesis protein FimT